MPQTIIQGFEIIQIDEQQGTVTVIAKAGRNRLLQAVHQQPPIGKVGQGVVEGQIPDFIFRRLSFGNVGMAADIMGDFIVGSLDRLDIEPFGEGLTVLASIPDFALPSPRLLQLIPHIDKKSCILQSGFQDARRLSHKLIRRITGHFDQRLVDA